MFQDDKIIRVKNKYDATFWLAITFVCVMLILAGLILRTIFDNQDFVLYRIAGVDRGIPIEARGLPGFIPNQNDISREIKFITPPGTYDDVEGARKCGIYKLYKSSNPLLVSPKSIVAITFAAKQQKYGYGLEDFVLVNLRNLRLMFPGQPLKIGIVHLDREVIEKFETMRMPYYTVVFYFDKTDYWPAQSCAVFFFETPDGFWSIIWTAPKKILDNERGRERSIFLSLIKYMIMTIFESNSKNVIIVF